jgi:serine/threonine protein kinase
MQLDREVTRKMSQPYQHALPVGTRVESYEIRDVLGVGGFGITYRAFDHNLECDVAIKEYLPSQFAVRQGDSTVTPKTDGDAPAYEYGLKRFLEEARTLAKFRESHIVRVVRYLEAHHTAYLVMDYEAGEPLSAILSREMHLDEARITAIVVPILEGLRVVHAKNILHRDIKPANICLRRDGTPVLLDFGSARQALEQKSQVLTGVVTPGYAPIEQYFSDGRQGPWTDIYAIGATMYHCAIGVAPVVATERLALIQDKEADPVARAADLLRNRFSVHFLEALVAMMKPNAKDRPQTVDEALVCLNEGGKSSGQPALRRGATTGIGHGPAWEPGLLQGFETTLEPHVGPIMAKSLVSKAATKTQNVEELSRLLADFLPTEQAKAAFLSRTRNLTQRKTAEAAPAPVSSPPLASTAPQPGVRVSEPITTPAVDGEQQRRATEALAVYLGPFARVLVKNAARRAADASEFFRLLGEEIADDKQREAFLRAMERGRAMAGN